ncbi:MAG: hypothetical protein ACYTG6_01455 [Planctomycetota bacterium]|jgi:hypothetical protein
MRGPSAVVSVVVLVLATAGCRSLAVTPNYATPAASLRPTLPPPSPAQADGQIEHDLHEAATVLGWNLRCCWDEPWCDQHFSVRGTPYVHAFLSEPAFLGRDLFLTGAYGEGDDVTEFELEAELEWAFTRRIGVVLEVPAVWASSDTEPDVSGVGDVGLGVRLLLAETERFLLSGFGALLFPTGDDDEGLGEGQPVVVPGFSFWGDLGGWFTAQGVVAVEIPAESGDTSFAWSIAVAKSFPVSFLFCDSPTRACPGGVHGHAHRHYDVGVFSLLAEASGTVGLHGPDEGETATEVLVGVSYTLTDALEFRIGGKRQLESEREVDWGILAGFVFHL